MLRMMLACLKVDQGLGAWTSKNNKFCLVLPWLGVRWGELTRSAQYIEDPLSRARFLNSFVPGQYIDIKVLHAELTPLPDDLDRFSDKRWREGTVYVQIEKVLQGHQVVSVEEQAWNRTADVGSLFEYRTSVYVVWNIKGQI